MAGRGILGLGLRLAALAVALGLTGGCVSVSGSGSLFVEPSVRNEGVMLRRVAIVPNRLPANLNDPERWRRHNWEVARGEFERKGYEVVDYRTAMEAFEKSGLPVEDTKSSRDKYADLASQLGVDLIVVPYYGIFAYSKGSLFMTTFTYQAVATFQVYSAEANDFVARIDAEGASSYMTGFLTMLGLSAGGGIMAGAYSNSGTETVGIGDYTTTVDTGPDPDMIKAATILMAGGALLDLFASAMVPGPDAQWENAFTEAVREGLKPLFAHLSVGAPRRSPPAPLPAPPMPAPMPAPAPAPLPAPTLGKKAPTRAAPVPASAPAPLPPPPAIAAPAPALTPPPAPPPAPAPAAGACTADVQCPGDLICSKGSCVAPNAAAAPAVPASLPAAGPCERDVDCAGDLICVQRACVAP